MSAHGDDASKVRALDHGADDYVSKPFSVPELLARVRAALRHGERAAPLEATVIERGTIRIDLLRREAAVGDAAADADADAVRPAASASRGTRTGC